MFLQRDFHFDAPPYHPNDKFGYKIFNPLSDYDKRIGKTLPKVGEVFYGVKGSLINHPPIVIGETYLKDPLMLYDRYSPVKNGFKLFEVYDRGDVTMEWTNKGAFCSPTYQVFKSVELEMYREITDIDELVCLLGYLDIYSENGRLIETKTTYRKNAPNTKEKFLYDRGRLMEYSDSNGNKTRYHYDQQGRVFGY